MHKRQRADPSAAHNGAPAAMARQWRTALRISFGAMSKTPERPEQGSGSEARRLDSWKEIASFLRRGIRTVQRWEREEGLPVHRLAACRARQRLCRPNELTRGGKRRRRLKPPPDERRRISRTATHDLQRVTTSTAATFWPALSSDARMVVYVSDAGQDGDTPQLWLQQIGGSAVQLTSGLRDCAEPSFFANDTRVAFDAAGESTRNVYEIPTLGGTPRVLKQAARGARFSPDGKWLAYLALEPGNPLRLVPADGGAARTLAHGLVDIVSASWSDDGSCLLVVAHPDASVELDYWVVPVNGASPVDTGVFRRARQQGLIVITLPPAWAGDSVFYSAAGRQGLHAVASAPCLGHLSGRHRAGTDHTRGRLFVLPVGGARATGFRWGSRRHEPLVRCNRRSQRPRAWPAPPSHARRGHRQSADAVAGRPDSRVFCRAIGAVASCTSGISTAAPTRWLPAPPRPIAGFLRSRQTVSGSPSAPCAGTASSASRVACVTRERRARAWSATIAAAARDNGSMTGQS